MDFFFSLLTFSNAIKSIKYAINTRQDCMTDNGPSTEYLFIYPWTVTAAVSADTHLCILRRLVFSSPAKDLTLRMEAGWLLEKEGVQEIWDEAPCYTSLRSTCGGCYGGLGKLTVDREWEHKDNRAVLWVCRGGRGTSVFPAALLLLLREKNTLSSSALSTGGSNIFFHAGILTSNILSAFSMKWSTLGLSRQLASVGLWHSLFSSSLERWAEPADCPSSLCTNTLFPSRDPGLCVGGVFLFFGGREVMITVRKFSVYFLWLPLMDGTAKTEVFLFRGK